MAKLVVPISTAKLKELNLSPAKFPSCCEPDGKRVRGCDCFLDCRLKEKETGVGPCRKGIQMLKKNPVTGEVRIVNAIHDCFHIPSRQRELEMNGGALKVIASEGQEIELRGSVIRDEMIPGQGMTRFIDDKVMKVKIEPYRDPNTDDLLSMELAQKALSAQAQEISEDRAQELLNAAATLGGAPRRTGTGAR